MTDPMSLSRSLRNIVVVSGLLLIFLALPRYLGNYQIYILNVISVAVIVATGLNLLMGVTGQISIGHGAFFGIGAYSSTLLTNRLGFPFIPAVLGAGMISGLSGLMIGIPALRLSGHYLAMATLAFGQVVFLVLIHWEGLTNGPRGLNAPPPSIGGISFSTDRMIYYIILPIAVFLIFFAYNLLRSRIGRTLIAIRDSEAAAQSVGINLARYKILAFFLSATYAGIGGSLQAVLIKFITPDSFSIFESFNFVTMIVVGGMGSILGSVLGPGLLIILPETLRWFQAAQEFIFGVLLLIFIIFMPQGIQGEIMKLGSWLKGLFVRP